MRRRRPRVGDVIQLALPTGRYAYGRVLRDASVAFYRESTDAPRKPPIGSRDFQFVVGVYEDVPGSEACPVVGYDPSRDDEDDWPPPYQVADPITGALRLYHKGQARPATHDECEGLEPAAIWDLHHLLERLSGEESAG
jgi:hypothetical protein